MTLDELEDHIDHSDVLVLATVYSDTRRIEQVLEGQFDRINIQTLDLEQPENRSTLKQIQSKTAWTRLPMVFINGDLIGGEWELTSQQQLGINSCGRSTHGFANLIGYAGLIPFVALSLWYALTQSPHKAGFILSAYIAYAAIILTFVGAIHWGRSLHEPHMVRSNLLQVISIIPSIIGWVAIVIPPIASLYLLIAGYLSIYVFDRYQYRQVLWMRSIRLRLTIGVLLSLLICVLAAARLD